MTRHETQKHERKVISGIVLLALVFTAFGVTLGYLLAILV
jgi:Sec-independent protein secretion pathway component TatC